MNIATMDLVDQEFALPAAPEQVWKALADAEIAARWMLPDEESPGAPAPGQVRIDLVDADPGRRVSYRWREGDVLDSIVTFSILPDAVGGTRLRIVQTETAQAETRPAPVAMAGPADCRVSFVSQRRPLAANTPLLCRAA